MSLVIKDFQMPSKIEGDKITLKHIDENDKDSIQNVCNALFYGQTVKRIEKTMACFTDGPEDIPSLIQSLNQCFRKNGFNYFIFRGDEVIGQVYGIPYNNGGKSMVSMWGWISDKALRQGYMKEALKMIEDEHFSKNSDSLEIFVRSTPIIESFVKSIGFETQLKSEVRSYCRNREDWLREQQPHIIMHHDDVNILFNVRER